MYPKIWYYFKSYLGIRLIATSGLSLKYFHIGIVINGTIILGKSLVTKTKTFRYKMKTDLRF